MTEVNEAIRAAQAAVNATHRGDKLWGMHVHNLSHQFLRQYHESGDANDLKEALQLAQDLVDESHEDDMGWPIYVGLLGILLGNRAEMTDDRSDIDEAIRRLDAAVNATPENNRRWPMHAHNLGVQYGRRHKRTGKREDLDDAIRISEAAVGATPQGNKYWPEYSNQLATVLGYKFHLTGDLADLEKAIQVSQTTMDLSPRNTPIYATLLQNLGDLLAFRSQRTGSVSDVLKATETLQEATNVMAKSNPTRHFILNSFGNRLAEKFVYTKAINDLDKAIQVTQEALEEAPQDHPSRANYLNNLGFHLGTRFNESGAVKDLDRSLDAIREAIRITPSDHSDITSYLQNLGDRLGAKFRLTGNVSLLEESIQAARTALERTPKDSAARPARLHNIGIRLWDRFGKSGSMSDLEEAIRLEQEAVDTTPQDHPQKPAYLNGLGLLFGSRYTKVGAISDLDRAVSFAREAVNGTAEKDANWITYANNLSNRIGLRYQRTEAMSDLNEAIHIAKIVVDATPPNHIDLAMHLQDLGHRYLNRYERLKSVDDLDQAIRYTTEAVEATDEDKPSWPIYLNSLGVLSRERFYNTRAMHDIDGAVYAAKCVLAVVLEDDSNWAMYAYNLGASLGDMFTKTLDEDELSEVIYWLREALHHSGSPIPIRIKAGKFLLEWCAAMSDWQGAYEAAKTSMSLVPKLTSRSLQNADKQFLLSQLVGLASDGAAMALKLTQDPLTALDLLEQGRGVVAATLEEMRTDVLDFQETHPELAQRFIDLRKELELALLRDSGLPETLRQPQTRSFYDMNSEADDLLTEIRSQPGFSDFLTTPNKEKLLDAAVNGPLVVVNVSEYRCDAILIEQDQILSLPLTHLRQDEVNERARSSDLSSRETLEWLWRAVASPVLSALGFTEPARDGHWPHIWWIPTGALSKMPLHAAGYHYGDTFETVLDRAMSSYSSSVRAVIHGRRHANPKILPTAPTQLLLVAMEKTPGLPEAAILPFATKEVEMLHELCQSMPLRPIQPTPRKQEIMSHMPNCRLFHFAGHGYTYNGDPSKSCLLLEDWSSDPLSVGLLSQMNLRKHAPFLAYLSACGTSQIKDARFIDESIHLISAYQLAGFRHVVGTLWDVNDELCVDMARITYEGMRDGGLTDESVCRGLHNATRELRSRWLNGQTSEDRATKTNGVSVTAEVSSTAAQSVDEDQLKQYRPVRDIQGEESVEEGIESLPWVPYIHFGV
ncbi:CHAT domain-containing protein [Truncatella angustata]|uniref:CHAT domain-containing protein n=1 Tax=Truncatella angustata TaxID=152316 RepID=A0A9P8UY70_9PEZI|nr:CHAT domain-containing protein [Truncatella angustata]KAH6660538.1 CHAT domain-containing protein [Truncatella angustata]